MKNGREGYTKVTKQVIDATILLKKEASKIKGIEVLSHHYSSIVAIKTTNYNPIAVADHMKNKYGWSL